MTDILTATDAHFAWLLGEAPAPPGLRQPEGGVESRAILELLRGITAALTAGGCHATWLIVEAGEVVGLCGFKALPSDGSAEFGYGVAESRRRRGHAGAAVARMVEAVERDGALSLLRAETAVWNLASQAVLRNNGFARVGERHDEEDGDLYLWERPLTRQAG